LAKSGYITEIFGSFQGEGPFVGERHVFIRFAGCSLGCAYCDTPGSTSVPEHARFEDGPGMGDRLVDNPVDVRDVIGAALSQEVSPGFNAKLSITGGEPLEQPDFLRELLAGLGGRFTVLLETNGINAEPFTPVRPFVDIVSMDIKLPSVSGLGPVWDAHAGFLAGCSGMRVVVKSVVSKDTTPDEVSKAAVLAAKYTPGATFVIQPLTLRPGKTPLGSELLLEFFRQAKGHMDDVRVIPQVHRILGVR
jgi:7-carboxy-7-deazaguanine synthase